MNARHFTEAELELLREPDHLPHLHRMWMGDTLAPVAVAVATQRDGTMRVLPTGKPLQATIEPNDGAEEGGQFREPMPARVPRRERLQFDGFPLIGLALVFGLGVPLLIALWDVVAGFFK